MSKKEFYTQLHIADLKEADRKRETGKYSAVTHELVLKTLLYDKELGTIVNRRTGKEVFRCIDENGYRYGTITGEDGKRHRFMANIICWFYVYGEWPRNFVCCVNKNRMDIRFENLRQYDYSAVPKMAYKIRKSPAYSARGEPAMYAILYHGHYQYKDNTIRMDRFATEEESIANLAEFIKETFSDYGLTIDDAYRWYDPIIETAQAAA